MGGMRRSALREEEGGWIAEWAEGGIKRCRHQRGVALCFFLVSFPLSCLQGVCHRVPDSDRSRDSRTEAGMEGGGGFELDIGCMHLVGVILASRSPSWQPHPRPLHLHRRR